MRTTAASTSRANQPSLTVSKPAWRVRRLGGVVAGLLFDFDDVTPALAETRIGRDLTCVRGQRGARAAIDLTLAPTA
jgi:hypothetical protein